MFLSCHFPTKLTSRSFSSTSSSLHDNTKYHHLQTLLKRGFTPTLQSINNFFFSLSQTKKFTLIANFFSQLKSNQINGNSQTHSILIWALLKLHKFEEAEHFINSQMAKSSNFPKNLMWDSLIKGFCTNRKDPEKALVVLRDCLRNHGKLPSSFTFCSLIHCFCSQGNMSRAIEVLELMIDEKVRYPFDNFVCSSVISGFCKIGKPELALGFFENAMNSGALRPNVVTYTALVSALCMLGRVNEVADLAIRMEKEKLALDVVFYSSWVCGYFWEGYLVEAFLKTRQMVERGIYPDTISYTILIDGFSKEGNVEKALGFLNRMIKDGLKPDLITYTAIMMGFCRKGKLEEAFVVFRKVEDMGIEADEFMFAVLIDGLCRRGDLHGAFCLLDEMENKGIKPSIISYNIVINGLCKIGRTFEADDVSKVILGDAVTYSTLLHGYVEEENVKGVLETRRRLEEAGCRMDVVMCNILMKALFLVGAFEDIYTLYQSMPEMGVVADSVTYCTLIDGFCKVGRIEEALEIFDEFRRTSFSSVACYNCIINGLCKNHMVDMAIEVFIELNDKGLSLDVDIYRMLVKTSFAVEGSKGVLYFVNRIENLGADMYDLICDYTIYFLCKRGFAEAASELCMVMKRKGSVLNSRSFYLILKWFISNGKSSVILPFLNIFVKEYGLVENRVSNILLRYLCLKDVNKTLYFLAKMKENYSTVTFPLSAFKALMNDHRVLDVYKLVTEAEHYLPVLDVVDYSIIVDRLCKGGHPRKALDICSLAKKRGITLNIVTYNSVINGLCRQGCLVEAFRLFDSLDRINLVPSEITYATLIDNLCKQGLMLDAKQLFERMVLMGLKPNTRVYNSLIDGYCKFGLVEEGLELLSDLEIVCLKPDEFTVSAVINGCCWNCDMERALKFFYEFKEKGISPDFLGFLCLIRGLCTKGRMEEARSILREMLQSKSVVELINQVDTEVESESIESFLIYLCEQGSIREAINVLKEIGSMFFHLPRQHIAHHGSQAPNMISECGTFATVASRPLISKRETDLGCELNESMKVEEAMENYEDVKIRSRFNDFGFCYSQISLLCAKGEVGKANNLVKQMLSSLEGNH
ncbi:PPR domain-containing protein/PPR_1 domain-containing protein/PPR_2 domain-containing protein [Cephalotus follicularis]|uniref:PPR domain-containing protein/PPR_1 domain-containing protein/PPR_2 domain-containing protein n=1 Tax=Cephalotus follicularis TaxID=3775 RepID=A0A1Q3CW21_CEPFO|nr:PPR domain-containing protein/PPR_1 domain-containing protein/PPR_2 domain-containing protein [Cephalotus follicularis]